MRAWRMLAERAARAARAAAAAAAARAASATHAVRVARAASAVDAVRLTGVTACAVFVLGLVAVAEPAAARPVDRVALVVDREVVTARELEVESRVALLGRAGPTAAAAPLPPELAAELRDYVIDQMLVALQAQRLGAEKVAQAEVDSHVAAWRRRFASPAACADFMRRFGITDEALVAILRREAGNARAVAAHLRGRASTEEDPAAALRAWLKSLRQGAEIRLPGPAGELERQGPAAP